MKEFVERSASSLVPGSLLVVIAETHSSRARGISSGRRAPAQGHVSISQALTALKSSGVVTNEQAAKIQAMDAQFAGYYREVLAEIPEIAEVTGCNGQSIERVARSLFGARLLSECLEVLVPADASYEVTTAGAVDLLAE